MENIVIFKERDFKIKKFEFLLDIDIFKSEKNKMKNKSFLEILIIFKNV